MIPTLCRKMKRKQANSISRSAVLPACFIALKYQNEYNYTIGVQMTKLLHEWDNNYEINETF